MKILIALLLMSSAAVAGEKVTVVVCPPNLSYCYKASKPLLPDIRVEDGIAAAERWLVERQIENQRPFRMGR